MVQHENFRVDPLVEVRKVVLPSHGETPQILELKKLGNENEPMLLSSLVIEPAKQRVKTSQDTPRDVQVIS